MPVTAESLFLAASLDPSQFDEDIVSPALDEAAQKAALIAYIDEKILPKASGKAALTLHKATGYLSIANFVNNHSLFASLSSSDKAALIVAGETVFDDAVEELSVSKLEKQVDTDAENYVDRMRESRIAAKESLQLITDWAEDVLTGGGVGESDRPASNVTDMTPSWY